MTGPEAAAERAADKLLAMYDEQQAQGELFAPEDAFPDSFYAFRKASLTWFAEKHPNDMLLHDDVLDSMQLDAQKLGAGIALHDTTAPINDLRDNVEHRAGTGRGDYRLSLGTYALSREAVRSILEDNYCEAWYCTMYSDGTTDRIRQGEN